VREKNRTAPTIDTAWFLAKLEERGLSQRGLAKLMGLDHAAVHLMLHGRRIMSAQDGVNLAAILRIPIETLVSRATGIPESALHGTPSQTEPSP
jgi:transcriptional regulator with XRE-family HTH domain